jgi:hypothetical protein
LGDKANKIKSLRLAWETSLHRETPFQKEGEEEGGGGEEGQEGEEERKEGVEGGRRTKRRRRRMKTRGRKEKKEKEEKTGLSYGERHWG